jgi:outer membrane murein-binding lipoprotein Lpp
VKKTLFIVVLTIVTVLAGCAKDEEIGSVKKDVMSTDNSIQNENKTLHAQVIQLQSQLKDQQLTLNQDPNQELTKAYPGISAFTSTQDWTSISVKTASQTVTVSDPNLLDIVGQLVVIKPERIDFTNGPKSDIDNFSLILTNNSGTYMLDIVARDIATFPELVPGAYFRISSNVADLGRALMSKPDYVPIDSLETRMLNSGMIHVKEEQSQFYMVSSYRVRGVAITFLSGTKKEIPQPQNVSDSLIEDITFYLFGNQIEMKVYPTQIQIKDGNREIWYQVDKKLPEQIHGFIAAG